MLDILRIFSWDLASTRIWATRCKMLASFWRSFCERSLSMDWKTIDSLGYKNENHSLSFSKYTNLLFLDVRRLLIGAWGIRVVWGVHIFCKPILAPERLSTVIRYFPWYSLSEITCQINEWFYFSLVEPNGVGSPSSNCRPTWSKFSQSSLTRLANKI